MRLGSSEERFPVNLGNPVEMTILEFAERIQRLMGTKSELIRKPLPSDDPKQRKPDIAKAARVLGWAPRSASKTVYARLWRISRVKRRSSHFKELSIRDLEPIPGVSLPGALSFPINRVGPTFIDARRGFLGLTCNVSRPRFSDEARRDFRDPGTVGVAGYFAMVMARANQGQAKGKRDVSESVRDVVRKFVVI